MRELPAVELVVDVMSRAEVVAVLDTSMSSSTRKQTRGCGRGFVESVEDNTPNQHVAMSCTD